jgi:hypothetical protein
VHLAIVYSDAGWIRIYRDGRPYGSPYRLEGQSPLPLEANQVRVAFGLRHLPAGGNRMLAGTVVRARVYDRALSETEVAASAATFDFVEASELAAALPENLRDEWTRARAEVDAIRAWLAAHPRRAYAVSPREDGETTIQLRGNPAQPGAVVSAGGIAAVAGLDPSFGLATDAPEAERRRRLASWVTNQDNPLFARVIVNRLWLSHFGSGLVETPSDFGFNGGQPSHPELLDWLASELVASGWSLKSLHRQIVSSAAYRQSSRLDAAGRARDAGDRLLWRKAPVRLEAEMVRDAMLAVSGQLNERSGGPSFRDVRPSQATGTPAVLYVPESPSAAGMDRRTLFRTWARGGRSAFLDAFDCPDPSTTAPRRASTSTPLQALALLNNALVLHLADAFAARLVSEAGPDARPQVERAYRLAYGRQPEPAERDLAVAVVERFGAATLARAIFNSSEFLYVH